MRSDWMRRTPGSPPVEEVPPAVPAERRTHTCGGTYEEGSNYCSHCGAAVRHLCTSCGQRLPKKPGRV